MLPPNKWLPGCWADRNTGTNPDAENNTCVESDQPKDRWSSDSGNALSRPRYADEPLRRLDAVPGTERAAPEGWSDWPNLVVQVCWRVPSRTFHGRADRFAQPQYQESRTETHFASHQAARPLAPYHADVPLRGRPGTVSQASAPETDSRWPHLRRTTEQHFRAATCYPRAHAPCRCSL